MLKKIFGSGARVKLLKHFLSNLDGEFFIRELTRTLDEQINSLRRELENLENIGLLKSKDLNRKKYYRVNPHFTLLPEMVSIFRKTDENNEKLLKQFNKIMKVSLLILTGKFTRNNKTNIDIFVVGEGKKEDIEMTLNKQYPNEKLKFTFMEIEDFLYRITLKDKFIVDLFSQKDNIVIKNKHKKEIESFLLSL